MDRKSKVDLQQRPFFVYGTLLPTQPNAVLWQGLETEIAPATLKNGQLHDMGGYPMLVETEHKSVKGNIVTISANFYDVVMARIDFLEGFDPTKPAAGSYRRVVRNVTLSNGRAVVPNGDWLRYNQNQQWLPLLLF